MAPWNYSDSDFPSLAPPTRSTRPSTRPSYGFSHSHSHSHSPSILGGGPRPWGRGGGGGGGLNGRREKTPYGFHEPTPFDDVDDLVENLDELKVTMTNNKSISSNGNGNSDSINSSSNGINFDAYEDIPVEASGVDVPKPVNSFAEIDLGRALNDNIRRCKYVKPTPIQRHAIPVSMAGRDLMACAQTGSGKTAAFCFPIIAGILKRGPPSRMPPPRGGGGGGRVACPLALIMSPTRELSSQIHEEAQKFAYQTGVKVVVAYGGAPMSEQLRKLEKGVDILVATPGRLNDMIERGRVSLRMIRYLALDEADRMLDMGFEPQIRRIVQQTDMPSPGARQTMLFSATFPSEIQRLASDFLSNYIFLTVGRVGSSTDLIAQKVEFVNDMDKRFHLKDLLLAQKNGTNTKLGLTIVFVETKRGADDLVRWLSRNGFPATAIHGDKVQMERERALRSFKSGTTPIMVATDVAARGLDIPSVAHVVNFDLPRDIDDYVHRIGRTGRAGKSGIATAFFNEKNLPIAKSLVDLMEEANQEVPSWLTEYAESASMSYGGYGGGGARRSRGGSNKFGGRDYRSFDSPGSGGGYSGHSGAAYTGGGGGYSDHAGGYTGGGGGGYSDQAGGYTVGGGGGEVWSDDHDPFVSEASEVVAADDGGGSFASPAYGLANGYEAIVATGWD